VVHTLPARQMFWAVAENAWHRGDPGNLFIDRANRDNPCPTRYVLEATNPCGEQWLPPYGSCNLGSIALHHFASWPEGGKPRGSFDWERFRRPSCSGPSSWTT
jgi:ribonucleoside-diphosphate reductase alpha chain